MSFHHSFFSLTNCEEQEVGKKAMYIDTEGTFGARTAASSGWEVGHRIRQKYIPVPICDYWTQSGWRCLSSLLCVTSKIVCVFQKNNWEKHASLVKNLWVAVKLDKKQDQLYAAF